MRNIILIMVLVSSIFSQTKVVLDSVYGRDTLVVSDTTRNEIVNLVSYNEILIHDLRRDVNGIKTKLNTAEYNTNEITTLKKQAIHNDNRIIDLSNELVRQSNYNYEISRLAKEQNTWFNRGVISGSVLLISLYLHQNFTEKYTYYRLKETYNNGSKYKFEGYTENAEKYEEYADYAKNVSYLLSLATAFSFYQVLDINVKINVLYGKKSEIKLINNF